MFIKSHGYTYKNNKHFNLYGLTLLTSIIETTQ